MVQLLVMRKVYVGLSGLFFILGLILAFENIMIPPNGLMIFLSSYSGNSMFFPLLFILFMGAICGFFLGMAIGAKGKTEENEYEDEL